MLDLSLKLMSGSFGLSLYSEAAILYLIGRSSGSIFLVGGESSTFFISLGFGEAIVVSFIVDVEFDLWGIYIGFQLLGRAQN